MNFRVLSAICLLCLVWSSLWGLVKYSLQIFPPFLFISTRLILGGLALVVVQWLLKKAVLPAAKEWKRLITLSLMLCLGFYATQTFAMQFVDSGLSAVLVFTMPMMVGVLAHYLLKEYLTLPKIIGLLLGMLGLMAILWRQILHIEWNMTLFGELILLVTAFFWACTTIYIKKYFADYDKVQLTIWQMLIGGGVIFVAAVCFEPINWQAWTHPQNIALLLYIALVGTSFAFLLWNWIVSQVDASIASISIMSIPILGLIFGHVFWHEPLTLNIGIGALFIGAGIVISSMKIKRQSMLQVEASTSIKSRLK